MSFATAINCMDGRVQLPMIDFVRKEFGADYIDMITEPGPIAFLAGGTGREVDSIIRRVRVSVEKHGSSVICIAGHYDCAGNPLPKERQNEQTRSSVARIKALFPNVEVVGVWINKEWKADRID